MARVVSILVVSLFVLSSLAFGFPGKYHGKYGKKHEWWGNEEVLKELGVTEEQKARIDGIAQSYKQRLEDLRNQVETYYEEFRASIKDPNSTRDQILARFDQMSKAYADLKRAKLEMSLDMRDVLSPEQRAKLVAIKESYKGKERKKECK